MGQTNSLDLPEPGSGSASATAPSRSRWWLWVLALGVIALGGWYYRSAKSSSRQPTLARPSKVRRGRDSAQATWLWPVRGPPLRNVGVCPVYFMGLGTGRLPGWNSSRLR